jgi:acetyl esterase/lipase
VASVAYRLSGEAPSPAAVIDVKTAIRRLRSKADEYGIDPDRAITWGGSAGGQLAGLTAVSCGVEALDPDIPPPAGAVDPEGRPTYQYAAAGGGRTIGLRTGGRHLVRRL